MLLRVNNNFFNAITIIIIPYNIRSWCSGNISNIFIPANPVIACSRFEPNKIINTIASLILNININSFPFSLAFPTCRSKKSPIFQTVGLSPYLIILCFWGWGYVQRHKLFDFRVQGAGHRMFLFLTYFFQFFPIYYR